MKQRLARAERVCQKVVLLLLQMQQPEQPTRWLVQAFWCLVSATVRHLGVKKRVYTELYLYFLQNYMFFLLIYVSVLRAFLWLFEQTL